MIIDNRARSIQNRSSCLICVPFGTSPYSNRKRTKEEILKRNNEKVKRSYLKRKEQNGGVSPGSQKGRDRKREVINFLGGSCMVCGYGTVHRNIVFHHLHDKVISLSQREFQRSWEVLIPEIKKCIMVCHNCHGGYMTALIMMLKDITPI